MATSPPLAAHLNTTEERLARLSVLQELTISALDLFAPDTAPDSFLERVAERLGCLAVLWVTVEPGHTATLVGAAGLSEASRALAIEVPPSGAPDWATLPLPYPEISREGVARWHFSLQRHLAPTGPLQHGLLLWFDVRLNPPTEYLPAVDRLVGVLRTVLTHRALVQDLGRSYEELARTQLALVERERLAAVGELAAAVAHEVRNPLAVIFNCIGTLKKPTTPPDNREEVLGILGEEANRLNQIVSELLDFARPHEARLHPESLEDVVAGAIAAVRDAQPALSSVRIELNVARPLPPVLVDARLVRRAVINLVGNALQAMPGGGRVDVRVATSTVEGVGVAVIEVSDDGPGIASPTLERIFEPFFTTKPSGTGLGLSIVKRVAEAHRGSLSVHSVEGTGTTFTLRLVV